MRTVFLVDTENVANRALKYSNLVGEKDIIYLFLGAANVSVSLEDALNLRECKAQKIEVVQCVSNGSNALDFQLSSYLGFLIRSAPKTHYAIISNDHGYNPLITFWEQQGTKVGIYSDIKDALKAIQIEDIKEDNEEIMTDDEKLAHQKAEEIANYNSGILRNKSKLGKILIGKTKEQRDKIADSIYYLGYEEINKITKYSVTKSELRQIKGEWGSFSHKQLTQNNEEINNNEEISSDVCNSGNGIN
ncbi:MAG: hypothetical protein J6A59_13045 [Lachnospiraceae bacterium]|nr:hypothetical protein [Lachnospiraceae bacterium]